MKATINNTTYLTVLTFTEVNIRKFAKSISAHVLNINFLNKTAELTQAVKGSKRIYLSE